MHLLFQQLYLLKLFQQVFLLKFFQKVYLIKLFQQVFLLKFFQQVNSLKPFQQMYLIKRFQQSHLLKFFQQVYLLKPKTVKSSATAWITLSHKTAFTYPKLDVFLRGWPEQFVLLILNHILQVGFHMHRLSNKHNYNVWVSRYFT